MLAEKKFCKMLKKMLFLYIDNGQQMRVNVTT